MHANDNPKKGKGASFIGITVIFFILLILAATAIPDFYKFQRKAHGGGNETRPILSTLYHRQLTYREKHGVFAGGPYAFSSLEWAPEAHGQLRYAYYCGEDYIANTKGDFIAEEVKNWSANIRPGTSATGFTCAAVGNIDNDPDLDYWFINDAKIIVNEPSDLFPKGPIGGTDG